MTVTVSPAGRLLKQWRQHRHVSQMDLGLNANVSTRHISFVETGRAQPSREMVLQLSEALDLPARDRNDLLQAAGYAPYHTETALDGPALADALFAIDHILRAHEPHGALVVDRHWNMMRANGAMQRLMAFFLEAPPATLPVNVFRLTFDPDGLRPFIRNFDEVAVHLLHRLERDVRMQPFDETLAALHRDLTKLLPPAGRRETDSALQAPPFLTTDLAKDGVEIRLLTTITSFGTAQDLTLQELRIETFHPADPESERQMRRLVEG